MEASNNPNPYIDEVSLQSSQLGQFASKAKLGGFAELEGIGNLDATQQEQANFEHDERELAEQVEGDMEFEIPQEQLDEFTPADPRKDREGQGDDLYEEQNKRKQRRIGRKKRVSGDDLDDFESAQQGSNVFTLIDKLTALDKGNVDEFSNWRDYFKPSKKKPPAKSPNPPLYQRELWKPKRNPHLWKSDPNPEWVLTFGRPHKNNKVSETLFKYQNETIDAAA